MVALMLNPFLNPPPAPPSSTYLTETDFASVYAAADFAYENGLFLDTTISIAWSLMGAEYEADISKHFTHFTKCARDWLTQRDSPLAWIYCHERGERVGVHTHMAIYVPGSFPDPGPKIDVRRRFKKWARDWVTRQVGRPVPRAIRVSAHSVETPWLHWLAFSYLCKGYDRLAVVQSGRDSPDGLDVMLGDLISSPFHEPGHVPLKQRVGTSRSLGPEARAAGVVATYPYKSFSRTHTMGRGFGGTRIANSVITERAPEPFRSRYENGVRDVRRLYGKEFYEIVSRVAAYPPQGRPPGLMTAQEWFDFYKTLVG